MNSKRTLGLMAALAVVLVAAGAYQQMNSTEPAEDDGTRYENETYDFSFAYDSERYELLEARARGGATGEESDLIRVTAVGESCSSMDIFISTTSAEQEIELMERSIDGETVEVSIDGVDATQREGGLTENISPCGTEGTHIVLEHSGHVILISAFDRGDNELEELLDTFNFN